MRTPRPIHPKMPATAARVARVPATVRVDGAVRASGAALVERAHALVRDFGLLAGSLAIGATIGATFAAGSSASLSSAARVDLALVLMVAAAVAAAVLPRADSAAAPGTRLPLAPALAAQRAFLAAACVAVLLIVPTRGIDVAIAWTPVVLFLQGMLAIGLSLFAAAVERSRVGGWLPARVLVPAWVLASPGAWLVHAHTFDSTPTWNPLHHLVAAWRAILLPGVGASEPLETALIHLAPASLLCALLGFAAFAAVDSREDSPDA